MIVRAKIRAPATEITAIRTGSESPGDQEWTRALAFCPQPAEGRPGGN
jgi:hypothetical protein